MKQTLTLILCVTSAAAVSVDCSGSHKHPENGGAGGEQQLHRVITLTPAVIKDIGLTVETAAMKPLVGSMHFAAKVIPSQNLEAQVGSLVQGRVREVFVNVGDRVREGQELMHIEGLEVGEIKSTFIKAKAHVDYTTASYHRQKTLVEQNVGSQKALLDAEAEYEKALAELDAADKRIHSIGLTDDDLLKFFNQPNEPRNDHTGGVLPIKAPISGVIVERNVVTGQLLEVSTTAFRIVNTSLLWADGQIYERDLPKLFGRPAVTLIVTAYPEKRFKGSLIYVSPVLDEKTRTITIRAAIPNPDGLLKPQMYGELHLPIGSGASGILIPAEAVLREEKQSYVFVATSDTTFERRDVTVGTMFDVTAAVTGGLRPGESVVTKGAFQLKSELMKETLEGGD